MELGGKAPSIVLPDADLDAAVAGCLQGALLNSGQVCAAYTRFLVHRSLADEFAERCAKAVSEMRIGPGSAPETELGPLVTADHLAHVDALVRSGVEEGRPCSPADLAPKTSPVTSTDPPSSPA